MSFRPSPPLPGSPCNNFRFCQLNHKLSDHSEKKDDQLVEETEFPNVVEDDLDTCDYYAYPDYYQYYEDESHIHEADSANQDRLFTDSDDQDSDLNQRQHKPHPSSLHFCLPRNSSSIGQVRCSSRGRFYNQNNISVKTSIFPH